MKKIKKYFGLIMILIIIALIVSYILITIKKSGDNTDNDKVPDEYIAVFHGGSGEITHETYIYKINNKQANSGFNYVNVTKTTTHWGSSEWNTKITKSGSVQWTDDVFEIARENNAYAYVTLPNSNKIYTIEEYMQTFLMN
mgnify:CR=1 FL=1